MGWLWSCRILCQFAAGLWNIVTLYNADVLLNLGPASMYARHPGPVAVSATLICPMGNIAWSFTAIGYMGATRCVLLLSLSALHALSSILFTYRPTFSYLNAWICKICLCVKQRTFCWIITVWLVITSKGKTLRSSHAAMLLMSLELDTFKWIIFRKKEGRKERRKWERYKIKNGRMKERKRKW